MATMMGAIQGMTGAYNSNSSYQMVTMEGSVPFIREAIDVLGILSSSNLIVIADYGSAHGLNSMYAMRKIIEYARATKKIDDTNQVLVAHNDLPTNNWTPLFELLNQNNAYHGVAIGRSFYKSCLPPNSLSIGYCSSALHFLSRKPCNIVNHCISEFAENDELATFQHQARSDLAQFLEHRSRELHTGGVLILNLWSVDEQGSSGTENSLHLLYKCAQSLSLMTRQELLEYSLPVYIRSFAECVDLELFDRYSLKLIKSAFQKVQTPFFTNYLEGRMTLDEFARGLTQVMRGWTESSLRQALEVTGRSEEDIKNVLTHFWALYEQLVKQSPHEHDSAFFETYLILKKVQTATQSKEANKA